MREGGGGQARSGEVFRKKEEEGTGFWSALLTSLKTKSRDKHKKEGKFRGQARSEEVLGKRKKSKK